MKLRGQLGVFAAVWLLSACTTPVLVAEADGNACHQNYEQVRKSFGEHFARPCRTDVDRNNGIVEVQKADALAARPDALMGQVESFDDNTGIYLRSHIQGQGSYYWMQPYPIVYESGVVDASREIEARWYSAQPANMRLFIYHRHQYVDLASVLIDVDGTHYNYVATWPAQNIDNAGKKNGSVQYFDVPYNVAKAISQAHQAQAQFGYTDGTVHQAILVQQGEPSLAAQGLRRLFNAIESR